MDIGVPREIMDKEFRVGMVPAGVDTLVRAGHRVFVERNAGAGSNIADIAYEEAGARIVDSAGEVFASAEMIIKVKEPLEPELQHFQSGQILYTFLHLAPKKELTEFLCRKRIQAIGYETIQPEDGTLPVLAPMSEVAGRMAVQVGAHYLEKPNGGSGVLLGGVPGVDHGRVTVIGGGIVGTNGVRVALAMGAEVTVIDRGMKRLEYLDQLYGGRVRTILSSEYTVAREVEKSDLVIGAVLVPGMSAPKVVTREMVGSMRPGSVIVDVAIDQGGCVETSRATTHSRPVFEVDGVLHYCVANMPGAVPTTSTFALANVTLSYALEIADKGLAKALQENTALRNGINVYGGEIVRKEVAESQGSRWRRLM
ncbi:MAG: alanine dehydrogenase [Desulfobulbaceae bacterium]|nr:alanine dehydrogenase [Desulfobulbaceae bacterium]